MTAMPKVTDVYRCPRCQRSTSVRGTPADVAAAIEAVRCRHCDGHAAGDHVLDDISIAGVTSRARRADRRAAARRRIHQTRRTA